MIDIRLRDTLVATQCMSLDLRVSNVNGVSEDLVTSNVRHKCSVGSQVVSGSNTATTSTSEAGFVCQQCSRSLYTFNRNLVT